jgi:hypothetical protein
MNDGLPFKEGPLFPRDDDSLAAEAAAFLQADGRNVEDGVAREDIRDTSLDSFRTWVRETMDELDAEDPEA